MKRQRQSLESTSENVVQESLPSGKKLYETPEVQDWGSILDLTRGLKLGLDDLPIESCTRVL